MPHHNGNQLKNRLVPYKYNEFAKRSTTGGVENMMKQER